MNQTPPSPDSEEDERDRRIANIFLAAFFILIVGGIWLVNAMVAQRDLDNCVAQGRRILHAGQAPAR